MSQVQRFAACFPTGDTTAGQSALRLERASTGLISGYRIVCFGDHEWEYEGVLQRMARDLARTNELIYVTSLGVRLPRADFRDARKMAHRLRLWTSSFSQRVDSARIISPLGLPLYNSGVGVKVSG